MKPMLNRTLPFITIIFFSLLSPGCERKVNEEELIAAAKETDERWVQAFNSGNTDALADLYWKNPSLLVYPSDGMELRGWDEVRASYARMLSHMKGATATISDPHYTVAGDVVVTYGRWTITVPTAEGPIFEIQGRYSDVKANKDGKWVIIMEHGSVPMPPPPDVME
jgi:uncharacterized protein (TIGR02246 family)